MLFWIFVVLAAVLAVWIVRSYRDEGIGFAAVSTAVAQLCLGLVFVIALLIGNGVFGWSADLKDSRTENLKALGARTGLEGRSYFLGGGYVKDKRVLNYITQGQDSSIRVRQADADDAVLYEDSSGVPTVITYHWDHDNGWLTPWPLGSSDTYVFHIPAGSVLENYTIDNSK